MGLLAVDKRVPQGRGLAAALLARASTVELDWDVRQKSRFDALDSAGRHLAVFLPRGQAVRGGDVLVAEDGSLVLVRAAPQALLRVSAATGEGAALALLRAAYHLGNRHVALALAADHLLLEPDPVLAEMLNGLGLQVDDVAMPFEPEGGAYGGGPARAHTHAHAEGHPRGHGHDISHGAGADPRQPPR